MRPILYASDLKPTILLAEDDPTQRMMLEHLVAEEGYTVRSTGDGTSALQLILKERFDILVTDLDMPGVDGQDLCRQVRSASLGHYVYILILTARSTDEDVAAGLAAGANDFLRKPIKKLELLARLKNAAHIVELIHGKHVQSIVDALSGLYNRGYLIDHLRDEVPRAQRFGRALALVMLDVDHFKRYNDLYGHAVGDQVIQGVARRLFALIRRVDRAVRYGGEEFVLLLPETSLDNAAGAAEKWRRALAADPMATDAGDLPVTASFGVAALTSDDTPDAVLTRADRALYQSKQHGRNRVTALPNADASDEHPPDSSA